MSSFRKTLKSFIAVAAITACVVPWADTSVSPAFAKDGGNGGHGDGHSGGNQGKSTNHQAAAASSGTDGKSRQAALEKALSVLSDDEANSLGVLNAAHASAVAGQHASKKSAVGRLATYELAREKALAITDPVQQELALNAAVTQLDASFGQVFTSTQIKEVNQLLDAR